MIFIAAEIDVPLVCLEQVLIDSRLAESSQEVRIINNSDDVCECLTTLFKCYILSVALPHGHEVTSSQCTSILITHRTISSPLLSSLSNLHMRMVIALKVTYSVHVIHTTYSP